MLERDRNTPSATVEVELVSLLATHSDKRLMVVGTTCTGKSSLLPKIPDAVDMDEVLFPLLSPAEREYVCQTPWTPEIGETMIALAKERIKVEKGKPVFGTVVLDCDLIILLTISDTLLRERTASRGVSFEDAKNMQSQILDEIQSSNIPHIEFDVG